MPGEHGKDSRRIFIIGLTPRYLSPSLRIGESMRKGHLLIVGIGVVAIATLGVAYLYFQSTSSGNCGGPSHYIIESERLDTPPSKYIILNSSEIEQYPLIAEVMDAFNNPDKYPGATVQDKNLTYEIFEDRLEDRVSETTDYLADRLLSEIGPPDEGPPYHFAYVDDKSKETHYYSWTVVVIDHAC